MSARGMLASSTSAMPLAAMVVPDNFMQRALLKGNPWVSARKSGARGAEKLADRRFKATVLRQDRAFGNKVQTCIRYMDECRGRVYAMLELGENQRYNQALEEFFCWRDELIKAMCWKDTNKGSSNK